jgi:hypothetical protein
MVTFALAARVVGSRSGASAAAGTDARPPWPGPIWPRLDVRAEAGRVPLHGLHACRLPRPVEARVDHDSAAARARGGRAAHGELVALDGDGRPGLPPARSSPTAPGRSAAIAATLPRWTPSQLRCSSSATSAATIAGDVCARMASAFVCQSARSTRCPAPRARAAVHRGISPGQRLSVLEREHRILTAVDHQRPDLDRRQPRARQLLALRGQGVVLGGRDVARALDVTADKRLYRSLGEPRARLLRACGRSRPDTRSPTASDQSTVALLTNRW